MFFSSNCFSETANPDVVVLSRDNLVVLTGEVNGENVGKVISQAKELDSNVSFRHKVGLSTKKPMYLFMSTPGGSIQSGLELIEALHGLERPIHTITLFSASMGFQIVQHLGDRLILKNGVLMAHRATGEFSGSFGGQSPSQLDSRYGLWMSRMLELDTQAVKRTKGKQTLESYQKAYSPELWMTGSQSVQGGYADKLVTVKCDESLDGVTTYSVNVLFFLVTYDLDNCPINTSPMNVRISIPDSKEKPTHDKVAEIKAKFMEFYRNKQKSVVPMYW